MQGPEATIDPIAPDIWRISIPLPPEVFPGGFSFNQYLVVDEKPLIFHTGPKKLFPVVRAQIEKVMPVAKLRYVAFSHYEADECGSLPEFLAAAPQTGRACGAVGANVSISDVVDVEPIGMEDGQVLDLGRHRLVWQSTPHLPHGWECGFMFDETSGTLFCGDLFTQPGSQGPALTESDILGPSEGFRHVMDYYAHSTNTRALIDKLAAANPTAMACMHGSAWRGDGAQLLRALADSLHA